MVFKMPDERFGFLGNVRGDGGSWGGRLIIHQCLVFGTTLSPAKSLWPTLEAAETWSQQPPSTPVLAFWKEGQNMEFEMLSWGVLTTQNEAFFPPYCKRERCPNELHRTFQTRDKLALFAPFVSNNLQDFYALKLSTDSQMSFQSQIPFYFIEVEADF